MERKDSRIKHIEIAEIVNDQSGIAQIKNHLLEQFGTTQIIDVICAPPTGSYIEVNIPIQVYTAYPRSWQIKHNYLIPPEKYRVKEMKNHALGSSCWISLANDDNEDLEFICGYIRYSHNLHGSSINWCGCSKIQ